ncbi:hypothetical protein [Sulfolobus spindle-shaped virus]|uniref:hypothetical protein n=1 Tax=Saccharolobus islandicus TaxID=43080 RepID=UPI00064FEF03|nr:hypothetical protein [Sulfolobus islandicus]AZG03069.1 hypothetical protein [Sulfolobus spindle-shaped virus]AZG03275.1 hypothetical protein [Sulfolobus spindle-shaped virus]
MKAYVCKFCEFSTNNEGRIVSHLLEDHYLYGYEINDIAEHKPSEFYDIKELTPDEISELYEEVRDEVTRP